MKLLIRTLYLHEMSIFSPLQVEKSFSIQIKIKKKEEF